MLNNFHRQMSSQFYHVLFQYEIVVNKKVVDVINQARIIEHALLKENICLISNTKLGR